MKIYTLEIYLIDGTTHWKLNGELHREDGPAIYWPNGHEEYWIHQRYQRKSYDSKCCAKLRVDKKEKQH